MKIALVGMGFMGSMHAQIYKLLGGTELAAVVDLRRREARKTLASLDLDIPVYASLAEALAAQSIDIVDICLPTDLHVATALAAIRAGKHVFCEKPIALNMRDALRIVTAAAKHEVFVQVGHCIRFWPEYNALEEIVRSGKLGPLRSLSLQRRCARPQYSAEDWLNDPLRSGGAALDLHIHDTDFVLHLLGRPDAVTSSGTHDASGWSHVFTSYHFADIAVTAEGGWNYPAQWGFQMAFQALFEGGTVEFDSRATPTLTFCRGRFQSAPLPFRSPTAGESKVASGNVASLGGYYNELEAFVTSLAKNQAPPIATASDAAESLEVTLAEIRSATLGRTVSLNK